MNEGKFVGRAGEKLLYAITMFDIPVADKTCADFGSSVGGFVDCLLQQGAKKVYAVETGYGELAWKLRNDPRVVVMERTNAMYVKLPERVDIITVDTSWTRQKFILPNVLQNLREDGEIISLIKPHYEADRKLLRHGILDKENGKIVLNQTIKEIENFGINVIGYVQSPLLGAKGGNIEYLVYLKKK